MDEGSVRWQGDEYARLKKIADEMRRHLLQAERLEATRVGHAVLKHFLVTDGRIRLKMYAEKEHQRPHLHIDYGPTHHVASVALFPPSMLEGDKSIPAQLCRAIMQYIDRNTEALADIWRELQSGGDPKSLTVDLPGLGEQHPV